MTNSPQFAELLSDDDETVIQYLENLTVEEYDDLRSGFTITMVSVHGPLLYSVHYVHSVVYVESKRNCSNFRKYCMVSEFKEVLVSCFLINH